MPHRGWGVWKKEVPSFRRRRCKCVRLGCFQENVNEPVSRGACKNPQLEGLCATWPLRDDLESSNSAQRERVCCQWGVIWPIVVPEAPHCHFHFPRAMAQSH